MITIKTETVKHYTTARVIVGEVAFSAAGTVAWRDLTIIDEFGNRSMVELFAVGGSREEMAERLRIVGDPVAEPAPVVEPVPANDYVEGDAC